MKSSWLILLAALCSTAHAAVGVRVLFGLTDRAETRWDGSASARSGHIAQIEPWRFEGTDAVQGDSWTASTHEVRLFGGRGLFGNQVQIPLVANGVLLYLDDANENTEIDLQTAQGNFTVRLRDIPYGKSANALNSRVLIDRVPPFVQLTSSAEEQDYPTAVADKSGNVWLAYMEFKHNPDHNRLRANLRQPVTDFSPFRSPAGGDQILVMKIAAGKASAPVAVTPSGGDLYRPAIAIDGRGRLWVFWSQNDKGNFDLWGRVIENEKPGVTVRLSREAGSDIDPVAATDSQGRVWVAWQGWRNGKASIFAATQNGNRFTTPSTVNSSSGNEWNPAIAADGSGRVTVAWDSYRNGNYDIYMRTSTSGAWGEETPVAASARYEAYPSLAYDPAGRLWIAYEEGGERWGKDFGAYDTTGLALYQGRAVRLVGFDRDGRALRTTADPAAVLPGTPAVRVEASGRQGDGGEQWLKPDPQNSKTRVNNQAARDVRSPKNTSPRLSVDPSGRIWLAVRSAHPIWWNPIGTVWSEYLVSYDGAQWTGPIFLSHSDNLLDNRPALVSPRAGELLVLGAADGRRHFSRIQQYATPTGMNPSVPVDPYNSDLFSNEIVLGSALQAFAVTAGAASAPAGPDPRDQSERAAVSRMRDYRKANLRIVRGEFHRHSEVSMDGGNDGTLLDQWRYAIDTGALDWIGCCDHDNGGGREYSWWIEQKLTDIFYNPGKFSPMFNYERSVPYPEGHRNVIFAQRGIRVLPRLPISGVDQSGHAPDTQMLYAYLKFFNGITASHTSGTTMGTDWRDNDALVEPAVEIYQGDRQNYEMPDAPRSNSEKDSIGGWRPKGFIDRALEKGFRLSFEASSDHVSTHISYANLYVTRLNRPAILEAFKARHLYAATDNILADVSSGDHMMGDQFTTATPPSLHVKLAGTAAFATIYIVKDGRYVYTAEPKTDKVEFSWMDMAATPRKTSYYYVRGEQENGEIVWASPMWITYSGK
ncbi:MAG TPA: hypothetical protein VG096_18685 [Bryobacteraceae bacterium]|jgi:hypothetical protein|nr:hypothetical protein [Bryobacteraceae bacterium]